MNDMWLDFTDYELCQVAHSYGLADALDFMFDSKFRLINRAEVELLLTEAEFDMLRRNEVFQ